jgi:hypothetical protein
VVIDADEFSSSARGGSRLPDKDKRPRVTTEEMYKRTLANSWYRTHRIAGDWIDEDLAWSIPEAREFGELAYEVAHNHGWLKYLDKLADGQLILLIIAVETAKVKKVLAKQHGNSRQPGPKPGLVTGAGGGGQQQAANGQQQAGAVPRDGTALTQYREPLNFTNLRAATPDTGAET